MSAGNERNLGESSVPEFLARITSLTDLHQLVGKPTPEEQQMLNGISLDPTPTQEELDLLGPNFTQRVIERAVSETQKNNPGR